MIIYIADPMCSWCYGFAPEITKVKASLPDHGFEIVLGGLRPGGSETMADLGDFLEKHWKDMSERTGQPINYDIIQNKTFVLDTEPACRAVVTARKLDPSLALPFFKETQSAFYVANDDMCAEDTFVSIATKMGLDGLAFKMHFNSEEIKYETQNDFQLAAEMGIQGFPSVVIRHKGQFYLASNGYRTADELLEVIAQIRKE